MAKVRFRGEKKFRKVKKGTTAKAPSTGGGQSVRAPGGGGMSIKPKTDLERFKELSTPKTNPLLEAINAKKFPQSPLQTTTDATGAIEAGATAGIGASPVTGSVSGGGALGGQSAFTALPAALESGFRSITGKDVPGPKISGETVHALGASLFFGPLLGSLGARMGKTKISGNAIIGTQTEQGTLITGGAKYATNSVTSGLTTKLLVGLGLSLGAAALAREVIGTYPFAGFIKEEALQTLSFGVRSATESGNLDLADEAIALQKEFLNGERSILDNIPWLNVHRANERFFEAAKLKTSIDETIVNQLRIQQETGETDDEKWARIDAERDEKREAQRIADEEYYAQVARDARKARIEAREDDRKYWDKVLADRDEKKRKEREAEEEYWAQVRIENDKWRDEMSPSNLNFGLL